MSVLKLKPKITPLTEAEKKRLIDWLENDLKETYHEKNSQHYSKKRI